MTAKTKTTAKDLMLAYLKEAGIHASKTKVGVNFQHSDWNFLLWHDAHDPLFFRLTLPGIFDVTDESFAQALMACNMLNWKYKVVKLSLYEFNEGAERRASVWVCYEQMLDSPDTFNTLVPRAMNALMEVADEFLTLVGENE